MGKWYVLNMSDLIFGLGECAIDTLGSKWCVFFPVSCLTITELFISLMSGGGFGNTSRQSMGVPLFVTTKDGWEDL